jgi:nucleotide-binding universal stress UspA family protein
MSNPKPAVVIGTSLCAESDQVIRIGLAAARAIGATERLVHCYEPNGTYALAPPELRGDFPSADARRRAALAELHEQARRLGVEAENLELRAGTVDWILGEESAGPGVELLVVGARAGESERWPRLGSTVDRLLGTVECPLLVVHPLADFPPRAALAPVDLSEISAGGLRRGLPLLEGWGLPAEAVELLFVVDPLEIEGSRQFPAADLERFAAEELERFAAAHGGPRSSALRRRVRVGKARAEAVEESAAAHADLLLVSTRGRSGWRRWLGGSFASTMAHRSHANVLVVPRPAALEAMELRGASADWRYVADEQPR